MDGARDCHRVKSEREKQISYINARVESEKVLYRGSYLQSRNRDTDIKNKRMDTKGVGGMGRIGRL